MHHLALFWSDVSLTAKLCDSIRQELISILASPQILQRLTWVNPPAITADWKRKVAQDAIESLSAAKLAKSICSQFRTRLNSSHEAFAASLRQVRALCVAPYTRQKNILECLKIVERGR